MSTLLPANRRAERFAALVDATSTTGADEPYAPLLEVVGTLRAAADEGPAPRADYVADLRSRLMAEADTAPGPDRRPPGAAAAAPHRPASSSRFTAAVAGLVLVGSGAGLAVAAQSSVPGDGLYPLKRGLEHVDERLNLSDAGRGRDLLGQATARLGEVDTLLERDASDAQVAATLRSFTSSAGDGADVLFRSLPAQRRRRRHRERPRLRGHRDGRAHGPVRQAHRDRSSPTSPRPPSCCPTSTSRPRRSAATAVRVARSSCPPGCGRSRTSPRSWTCSPRPRLRPARRGRPVRSPPRAPPATPRPAPRSAPRTRARSRCRGWGPPGRRRTRPVGEHGHLERAPGRTRRAGPWVETLPTPSAPASGLPNVDDVTDLDQVKKDLGSVTDPLTP